MSRESIFCPLTKENCRDDCAWADIAVELDEDGVTREVFCAITVLAAKLIILDEEEDIL